MKVASRGDYLVPLFVNPAVLERYFGDPDCYGVDEERGLVLCHGQRHIKVDRTKQGSIHTWLGDVAMLPLAVQRHWRVHSTLDARRSTLDARRSTHPACLSHGSEETCLQSMFRASTSPLLRAFDERLSESTKRP